MKKFLFILLVVVSVWGCRKEPTTWNTEVLAPLATGTLSLSDIIPDSISYVDGDFLYHLVFDESISDLNVDSLVTIPDTTLSQKYVVPFSSGTLSLPAGTQIISVDEEIEIGSEDVELHRVEMKSGFLKYKVKSYINGYMTCVYNLPGATFNGTPLTISASVTPSVGNTPSVSEGQFDLTNYSFDLTGENGNSFNRLFSTGVVSVSADAPSNASVQGQDSVVVELEFVDAKVKYAKGYFGQHFYSFSENVSFLDDIQIPSGILVLDQARMNLKIENNVGVDARFTFNTIEAGNDNSSLALDYAPFNNVLNITRAVDNGGTVTPFVADYFINEANSNLTSFIGLLPTQLNIQGEIEINPLGNISGASDFIYTDNPLRASVEVDVPLRVGMQGLGLQDTLDVSIDQAVSASGNIVLVAENYFPFSADIKLTLLADENYQDEIILDGGYINAGYESFTGVVLNPSVSTIRIPFTAELLERLRDENRMIARVTFNTPDFPQVYSLYDKYKIDLRLFIEAAAEVEIR